jgi:hypothetical protein
MTDDWPFSNNIISKSAINRLHRCKPRMHYQDAVTFYNEMVRAQITITIGYAGHNAK